MARVKRGKTKNKSRKNLLSMTSGYRWGRKNKFATAWTAMAHAGVHAFSHRRKKKGDFRSLWNIKINAALDVFDLSYSKFINLLKIKKVELNRKVLSEIVEKNKDLFKNIVDFVK